jgi:hypothetical protein
MVDEPSIGIFTHRRAVRPGSAKTRPPPPPPLPQTPWLRPPNPEDARGPDGAAQQRRCPVRYKPTPGFFFIGGGLCACGGGGGLYTADGGKRLHFFPDGTHLPPRESKTRGACTGTSANVKPGRGTEAGRQPGALAPKGPPFFLWRLRGAKKTKKTAP